MISDRDTDGRGFDIGEKGEDYFKAVMTYRGWTVEPSPIRENMIEHWDFKISKDYHEYLVDVKGHKRVARWDDAASDNWTWIEIKNNAGYPGWLYATKADFIAFQQKDMFHFVTPEVLRNWLEWRVDLNSEFVTNPQDARYRLYQRKGRKDVLTLINYNEMPVRKTVLAHYYHE